MFTVDIKQQYNNCQLETTVVTPFQCIPLTLVETDNEILLPVGGYLAITDDCSCQVTDHRGAHVMKYNISLIKYVISFKQVSPDCSRIGLIIICSFSYSVTCTHHQIGQTLLFSFERTELQLRVKSTVSNLINAPTKISEIDILTC